MNFILLLAGLLFIQPVLAQKNKPQPKKYESISREKYFQEFFNTLSSTNNTEAFLNKINLPSSFKNQFKDYLKGKKNKMFEGRKVSQSTFELKLKDGQWARFDLNVGEGILIGKKNFKWNFDQAVSHNLKTISQILKSEYPQNKALKMNTYLFPKAYAESISPYDSETVIVGATGALIESAFQADTFLNAAEHYCSTGSLPVGLSVRNLLNGNLSNQQNPYEDKNWVRKRFFEIRNYFVTETWSEYLIHPNMRYTQSGFNKFYDVQRCFLNKNYINSTEMREHPTNKDPNRQGHTPASN